MCPFSYFPKEREEISWEKVEPLLNEDLSSIFHLLPNYEYKVIIRVCSVVVYDSNRQIVPKS